MSGGMRDEKFWGKGVCPERLVWPAKTQHKRPNNMA